MFSFFDSVRRVSGDQKAFGACPPADCTHPPPGALYLVEKIHLIVGFAKPYFVGCLKRGTNLIKVAPHNRVLQSGNNIPVSPRDAHREPEWRLRHEEQILIFNHRLQVAGMRPACLSIQAS